MDMNRQKIIIIALSVALFLTAQYIFLDKLIESNNQKMSQIYQRGYDSGAKDAITALYQQTQNCQISTITLGNLTKHVFDLACLKKGANATNP